MTETPAVFRYLAFDRPGEPETVLAKLEKLKTEKAEAILAGFCQDWPDYKQRLGTLQGLSEAINICRDVKKEMDKR